MNRFEIEVQQSLLDSEAAAIKELEKQYEAALRDINEKVKLFQADIDLLDQALSQDGLDDAAKALLQSQKQSKIYQKQYQQALKGQVSGIIDKMHSDHYTTIDKYLNGCYETGYIGTMYDIAKQGVPIIAPIDQAAAVKAVLTDSKIVEGYYNHLGVSYTKLKKTITQEVSRGIASGLPYRDIARNIHNVSGSGVSNAKRIARTEGHRIQQTSARDAQYVAKKKGADVVKQWDAALDKRTRDSHARVDGEIRELDEEFSNGLMFPGDPSGSAAEVINCRCTANTRARWALDDSELQTLKDRAAYFGLDKTDNFDDFSKKYLKAVENSENGSIISTGAKGALTSKNDPDYSKRNAHATRYYSSIRNSDRSSIVAAISENVEIDSKEVGVALDHLFYTKHELEKGFAYFEEDYDIAESIQRLRDGRNIQPHDLILIQHEALEAEYMSSGMSFDEAHSKAESQYNYTLALRVFLKANNLE